MEESSIMIVKDSLNFDDETNLNKETKVWFNGEFLTELTTWDVEASKHPNRMPPTNCMVCQMTLVSTGYVRIPQSWTSRYSKMTISQILEDTSKSKDTTITHFLCKECYRELNRLDYHISKTREIKRNFYRKMNNIQEHNLQKDVNSDSISKTLVEEDIDRSELYIKNSAPKAVNKEGNTYYHFQTKSDTKNKRSVKHGSVSQDKEDFIMKDVSEHWLGMSCKFCKYSALHAADQRIHEKSHYCVYCNIFLRRPSQMKTHTSKVHFKYSDKEETDIFKCSYCSKKYSSKGSLHNHKKTVHNSQEYSCNVCDMKFRHMRLLQHHKVRHQEKTIECSKCSAKFYHQTELNKHDNQSHGKVRPYQCQICSKKFCQRSVLNHHLSQHDAPELVEPSISLVPDPQNDDIGFVEMIAPLPTPSTTSPSILLSQRAPLDSVHWISQSLEKTFTSPDMDHLLMHSLMNVSQTLALNSSSEQDA